MQCNTFIIGDSTFHYWICLLNQIKNPKSVVYTFDGTDFSFNEKEQPSFTNRKIIEGLNWNIVNQTEDDFIFMKSQDQSLNDLIYYPNVSVSVLRELALNNKNCAGFNTMGYLKNNINNLTPLVGWNVNDGIYVKKINVN